MSVFIHFESSGLIHTLNYRIYPDIEEICIPPKKFDLIWEKVFSNSTDDLALEIKSDLTEPLSFIPDKTLRPRVSFTNEQKVDKVMLCQLDKDICEIGKNGENWEINLTVVPKGTRSINPNIFPKIENQPPVDQPVKMSNLNVSFVSNLTEVGVSQRDVLEKFIEKTHKCFIRDKYYAPLSPIIQSSGYGKSKICDEVLLIHPGIPAVFRGGSTNLKNTYSYPPEQSWIKDMVDFIYKETVDELPESDLVLWKEDASKYSVGCFLIAIRTLIIAYYKWYEHLRNEKVPIEETTLETIVEETPSEEAIEKTIHENKVKSRNRTREEAIKKIGESFLSGSRRWGHDPNNLVFKKHHVSFSYLLKEIECLLRYHASAKNIIEKLGISNNLVNELMPESSDDFPFLFVFDEATVFDHGYHNSKLRLSGLHVLRRALHLLPASTSIHFLTIGTNSDAIDFSPVLRIDSIRDPQRSNLLPAFWITRNSGIFSKKLKLNEIEVSRSFLLNRNVMKLFFAMGRPLWASYRIKSALSRAIYKVSNGSIFDLESLISFLLCRADLNVIPTSILCRNLVKSHMATVYYISTDSRSMKIGYPSEPALALASRENFKNFKIREAAFVSLFEFLQRRAIDKGCLSETIMEHFVLFAVDDVILNSSYLEDYVAKKYFISTKSGTGNNYIDKVLACETFILDIDWENDDVSDTIEDTSNPRKGISHEDYHVINVTFFLKSLFTENQFSKMVNCLPKCESLMNGYINISHFVNLERDTSGILSKLSQTSRPTFKVDRSLLKMGLIRGCGYVLPPGTYGLDFIIPVLLDEPNLSGRPRYSFIGIQVKTKADSFYTEVAKTALPFLIERCLKKEECSKGNHHSGCMSNEEYEEIIENQLTLILCADKEDVATKILKTFFTAKPQVLQSSKRSRTDAKDDKEKEEISISDYDDAFEDDEYYESENSEEILEKPSLTDKEKKELKKLGLLKKIEYAKGVVSKFLPESTEDEIKSSRYFKYPTFDKLENQYKPDLLIKNEITEKLSVQNLFWDRGDNKITRLTCIISADLDNFAHLATPGTIDVCKKIVAYVNNIFDDVDEFNIPAVVDSSLNIEFSKFYEFNPELRSLRGEKPISNDEFTSMSYYIETSLSHSIKKAVAQKNGIEEFK